MKQINVSKERCIGCGACVAIDPEHFEFDEEGQSSVINNENLESENLLNAMESCPTAAIEMIEKEESAIEEDTEETESCECDECNCEECEHHKQEDEIEDEEKAA